MRTRVRITTRMRQTDGTLIVNRQDTRPAASAQLDVAAAEPDCALRGLRGNLQCQSSAGDSGIRGY